MIEGGFFDYLGAASLTTHNMTTTMNIWLQWGSYFAFP